MKNKKFKEKWMYTLHTAFVRAGLIEKRDSHCGGGETIGKTRFRFSELVDFIECIPLQKARNKKILKYLIRNEKKVKKTDKTKKYHALLKDYVECGEYPKVMKTIKLMLQEQKEEIFSQLPSKLDPMSRDEMLEQIEILEEKHKEKND